MVAEEVVTVVPDGEVILIVGGVDTGAAADRVTFMDWTALLEESAAVTVMVLAPTAKGTDGMLHVEAPAAVPLEPWLVCQVTATAPLPPEVVPFMAIWALAVVVLGDGEAILSANGGAVVSLPAAW
jgi:hypothetical protein